MVRAAIRIGARMGISLTQGDMVEATGNGLLEAVKGNVEHRDIFERKIEETITSLRESCEDVGDKVLELLDARSYRIKGCSDEDWARGVQHHAEYFGDMMLVALAHFIGKNILVINTDSVSAPVRVVFGDRFCWHCPPTQLDSEYPVILAHNGTLYESLVPVTDRDELMARSIIQRYVTWAYTTGTGPWPGFFASEEKSPDLIPLRLLRCSCSCVKNKNEKSDCAPPLAVLLKHYKKTLRTNICEDDIIICLQQLSLLKVNTELLQVGLTVKYFFLLNCKYILFMAGNSNWTHCRAIEEILP